MCLTEPKSLVQTCLTQSGPKTVNVPNQILARYYDNHGLTVAIWDTNHTGPKEALKKSLLLAGVVN